MKNVNIDKVSVWPEYQTGNWIVSELQAGTNNELVLGIFGCEVDAERHAENIRKSGIVC
jgi:hypothetical protein